ncbi:preprotein translocase subunit SecA [Sporobacter termitidis DSM 10068]|uniref:Protein translocase subunit SecA n=2 Tax=Sporobacter TaxID=44748 RepID=A0A1M5YVB4_9FIRM|nr:preprotein translocase subunit SecA [Sporobacter termitidis DSM 10068]
MVNLKNIEYDLKPLGQIVQKIKTNDYSLADDAALRRAAEALRARAAQGGEEAALLPEAFAFVGEAAKRALGLTPHDVQLMAAAAMARGDIVELATGEGKTLAAVFVAALKALYGKGVHVLTFNDYLAARDAAWMAPVYARLGLTVGHIAESMDRRARQAAYGADVTYLTAKEAGFDYLRGFLAFEADDVVLRDFRFAVIDEADSILIDEARIPLVIAGDEPSQVEIGKKLYAAVARLRRGRHFAADENDSNIYLEDEGIAFLEEQLGLGDLYDEKNLELLSKLNVLLQAEYLLKRDVDYIVRNGEILLVDEFTGRVAKNRQWSDGLHAAVELKEGLAQKTQGRIMNSITLQSFLRLYPGFCGMTGTARPAAAEFLKFYDKSVTVIPPHRTCVRADHPDVIFTHRAAKYRAVAGEVKKAHRAGRPVLVGTGSIEESERLAGVLRPDIPEIAVLNAKNDAEEALIITDAGRLGAVTISTNMAGRGVDIRLGGSRGEDYDKVCALGGLYVIGTNRHESVRVDDQLRGRAGRQGDPGDSRFFVSLEDELVVKYGLIDRIPAKYKSIKQEEPLDNPAFARAILRTQKYVEAQTFDAKTTLFKYAQIVEDQRRLVHKKRDDILFGRAALSILERDDPDGYRRLLAQVSPEEFRRAQKQIALYAVNQCWSDHLLYVESLRDEIFMLGKVRGDPLTHYNERLIEGFELLEKNIRAAVLRAFGAVAVRDGRIDLLEMGIKGPTSTRTYLVHDGTEQMNLFGAVGEIAASAWSAPLYLLNMLFESWKRKRKS